MNKRISDSEFVKNQNKPVGGPPGPLAPQKINNMAIKRSKRYEAAAKLVDKSKVYSLEPKR